MDQDGIAIIGIAAQLPAGAGRPDLDYASFWDFLVKGGNAYEALEGVLPGLDKSRPDVSHPLQGAFLKNPASFDHISLGVSTRDARVIPYSARRLLDLSFQALLDSGIESRGRRIGCYMSGNRTLGGEGQGAMDADGSFAWSPHAMANRISYALDLTGPSILLDTACSSSLNGLHLAISAIERGECEAALVGAAQINRDPFEWTAYAQGGVLSQDGMTRPMDAAAKGFARGEGAVVVVLKSLKDALRDHDHIYSVVLGSAINATGSRMPLNVPNGVAQKQSIYEAYKRSGLDPKEADYVELHATGTFVGDPIEANATGQIFAKDTPSMFGSIKGNIGHLEVAAFLASLVKACLMFEHGVIPPTVNLSNPTTSIDWAGLQMVVPTSPVPLPCLSPSGRSIISLSSSGLGGTTGHVVVQAPPPPPSSSQLTAASSASAPILFLVGGTSSTAVDTIARGVLQLDGNDPKTLRECAVTLSRRARQLPWRKYFVVPLSPRTAPVPPTLTPKEQSPLVYVFSGQGPQHLEMGRQLFAEYPVFRNTILELDAVYKMVRGVSLMESTGLFLPLDTLKKMGEPSLKLPDFGWPVTITVSAIAMLQMALFDLLKSVGITPDAMLGHSAGETAILYASGAGSRAMAMEVAIARGEAMTCTEGVEVGMAMLACDAQRGNELIALVTKDAEKDGEKGKGGILEVSCYNAPDSIAVSGTASLLDALVTLAKSKSIFAQRIRTLVPGHSSFMDPIRPSYLGKMEDIWARYPGPHTPTIPVYSTCRKDEYVGAFSAEYFWDNCRNAVLFSKAVDHALALPSPPVFLELSCHAVLASSILAREVPDMRVLCPMRRASSKKSSATAKDTQAPLTEPEVFLDTLGKVSLLGLNALDLSGMYGRSAYTSKLIEHPLVLRAIPAPKVVSGAQGGVVRRVAMQSSGVGPLSAAQGGLRMDKESYPDLAEHVINGEPIFPATGYIELLLEAGANYLWDVEFVAILSLTSASASAGGPGEVGLQRLDSAWSVTTGTQDRVHARGFMDRASPSAAKTASKPPVVDYEGLMGRLPGLDFGDFYPSIKRLAAYGPRFQRVVRCHGGPAEVIAELRGMSAEEMASGYLLNPIILDACLHVMLHPEISKQYTKDVMYLPSRLEHFVFYRRDAEIGAGNWFSHIRLRRWTPESRYYDITVTDSTGSALCELRNLMIRKVTTVAPLAVSSRFDMVFQPVAVPGDIPSFPTTYPERANKKEILRLYEFLDELTCEFMEKSVVGDVVLGEEESRHRYLAFARLALKQQKQRKKVVLAPGEEQDLREKFPYHFEIARRIATVHETVFQTPKHAVDALYSDDLMAKFYSPSYQTTDLCSSATKAFSEVLDALRRTGKKSIKVLEVGAGTGLFTRPLIEALKRHTDLLVEYTVTDISYALVSNLARDLPHPSVIPKAYDISKDAEAQGIYADSYDVILALHVLHAAPNVTDCLVSLRDLLVPGGCLLICELDGTNWRTNPGSTWFDGVFGPFQEWFAYADERVDHCTLPPATWKTKLEAVKFVNVQTCIEDGGYSREFYFAAQKTLAYSSPPLADGDLRHVYAYEFGKEMELQKKLAGLDAAAALTVYVLALQGRDADAAVGLCASLRKDLPAWEIRLAIFASATDLANPTPLLARHMGALGKRENVISFDKDGSALVPRVVLSAAPSATQRDAVDDPGFVTVRVSHWAGMSDLYDGFVGQVAESHEPGVSVGDFVGGVVEKSSVELLRVHANHIVSTTTKPDASFAVGLLGTVLPSLITWPASGSASRVAVAIENDDLAKIFSRHASNISGVQLVSVDFRNPDILERLDVLISDSATYAQHEHLRRWIPRSGRVFLWDSVLKETIRDDPSYIRRTLAKSGSPALPTPAPALPNGRPKSEKPESKKRPLSRSPSKATLLRSPSTAALSTSSSTATLAPSPSTATLAPDSSTATLSKSSTASPSHSAFPTPKSIGASATRFIRRVASVPNAKALFSGSRSRSNSTTKNGMLAPSEPVPPVPPLPSVIVSDATDITIAVPHPKSRAAPPFRADRAYVLLGGIGGLGIDLAVWMYQHGARHLILTSRRGLESLHAVNDGLTLAKVAYLQSQAGLHLQFSKCDATDVGQMKTLLNASPVPLAGCFLMTLVLSDAPFLNQTDDTFGPVYASKLRVFKVLSTLIEIKSLDFLVTLSSISGLVGIPGQTNYASACTALDGVLAEYPNAFSLITPGIFDAGYLDRANTNNRDDMAIISADGLWAYLEDALRKVEDGLPFNQYIPAVDWRIIDRQFTLPVSCRHLLSPNSKGSADSEPQQNSGEAILTRVLELLEVSEPDFDVAQPLTTYGLDSISAAKLSSMLRPYGSFSPMQLLGGATWSEIETQLPTLANGHALGDMTAAKAILLDILGISADDFSPDHPLSSYGLDSLGASRLATALRPFMAITQMQLMGQTTWAELLELAQVPSESSSPALPAQPFVEVCSGSGQPLIILPGGNGSMGLFFGLRSHYKGPLWAVQVTETTPLESLEALVGYWKDQICAKWPQGPYKLAAFSGSTLLSIALTKMLEDAGKEVLQLTFIDHCPALWLAEDAEARLREKTVADFRDFSDASLLELLRIDSTSAEALVSYEAAINGLPDAPTTTLSEVKVLGSVMTLIFNFLHQFYPADRKKSHESFVGPFTAWLSSVKAPLVLLVAELGFVHCSPDGWSDLGANRFTKPVKVHYINSVGHFGLFKDQRVAQILNA